MGDCYIWVRGESEVREECRCCIHSHIEDIWYEYMCDLAFDKCEFKADKRWEKNMLKWEKWESNALLKRNREIIAYVIKNEKEDGYKCCLVYQNHAFDFKLPECSTIDEAVSAATEWIDMTCDEEVYAFQLLRCQLPEKDDLWKE